MRHYVEVRCPKCYGACFLDDRYDEESGQWLVKNCPECDGLGYVKVWTDDDDY